MLILAPHDIKILVTPRTLEIPGGYHSWSLDRTVSRCKGDMTSLAVFRCLEMILEPPLNQLCLLVFPFLHPEDF